MENDRTGLTERITFAEGWLDRARRQIQEGDLDRGSLTLILAEAEVHRAREVSMTVVAPGTPARARRPAWRRPAIAALAGACLVLAVLLAVWPRATVEAPDVAPLPLVRLSAGTGAMLRMVSAPQPVVERMVERRVILRVPVPVAVSARDDRPVLPVIAAPVIAPRPGPVPHVSASTTVPAPATPVAPAVAPAPVLLNEADVIDLVLAAERSLRRSANQ